MLSIRLDPIESTRIASLAVDSLCRKSICASLKKYLSISGAIIGDGDRKSWDSRGPMIWDNVSIFRTNCAILTSWIHARVVGSRVDVVTLRDQLVRVARYSCRFFTAMAGNKAEKKNQGSSVYFNALM